MEHGFKLAVAALLVGCLAAATGHYLLLVFAIGIAYGIRAYGELI